jgi:arylsulfatase
VLIAQAGRFGGWSLYLKDGKLHHEYNYFGLERTNIASAKPLTAGHHILKYEFVIDEYKPGAGGKCILYVDDQKVAEGYIPKTQPFLYSQDEGVDVGADNETPVSEDYNEADNKFTGKIKVVTVETFSEKK